LLNVHSLPKARPAGCAANRRSVTVNLAASPFTWLHARGHLSERQFDAGERLRADQVADFYRIG
jgi:hypothetical protein